MATAVPDKAARETASNRAELSAPLTRHVLWTGGWDSTFYVLKVMNSSMDSVVPHYIISPSRGSVELEFRAINQVSLAVQTRYGPGRLKPLRTALRSENGFSGTDEAHLDELHRRFGLGPQYLWIADYMRKAGLECIDLCIHRDDRAYAVIEWALRSGSGECHASGFRADRAHASSLFNGFRFPVLDYSKTGMLDEARDGNYLDLLELSWFCHSPTRTGVPCGFCQPCKYTRDEGLAYRLPRSARARALLVKLINYSVPTDQARRILKSGLRRLG